MNRLFERSIVRIMVFATLICILSVAFTSCKKKGEKLDAPTVTLEGNTASWDHIEGAVEYEAEIDGETRSLSNTTTSYLLEDGESIKVRAIGDGKKYLDSDWSNTVTYYEDESDDPQTPKPPYEEDTYTVIWKNGDTVLETDLNVKEGTLPKYNGNTPEKEGYKFVGWSPKVSSVYSDVTYYAQFELIPIEYYTVTFKDHDGTVLKTERVQGGTDATPPPTPIRSGYTFVEWQGEYKNVTSDSEVVASYISNSYVFTYTVLFKDHDGTVLKEEKVALGEAATAPDSPTRSGYRFDRWDRSFDSINSDTVITARYIKQYTVTFKDHDDTVLKEEAVDVGKDATPPEVPERDGYAFKSWRGIYTNVTADQVVTATYVVEIVPVYTVTFVDHDGTVLKTESVKEGRSATAPEDPDRQGHVFVGWDTDFSAVVTNLTVTAKYETTLMKVYVNYYDNGDGTVTAKFVVKGAVNVAALEMTMGFELDGASYKSYKLYMADSSAANYRDGIFYFSFMSYADVTEETELFGIVFNAETSDVSIKLNISEAIVTDDSFTETVINVEGTEYNK